MHKRYLDCSASDLVSMDRKELLFALRASEGRILVSETIAAVQPLLYNITNAELAASQGADLLLLNMFDVDAPAVGGMPATSAANETLRELQRLTGRLVGVNLEAVDADFANPHDAPWSMRKGRAATVDNARKLVAMGARFIVLTGNPANGVSNRAINSSLQAIKAAVGDQIVLIAGKMHSAGVVHEGGAKIITHDDVAAFIESGADIVLLPAPGTVPGMTVDGVRELVEGIHQKGAMAMTAIGTSQEGADVSTIRQIALMCKMAGADLHHIGDTGYMGIALPENIFAYSVAIRGVRHTYSRMARSVNR